MAIPVLNIHFAHFLKGFSCLHFNFRPVNIFSLFRKKKKKRAHVRANTRTQTSIQLLRVGGPALWTILVMWDVEP